MDAKTMTQAQVAEWLKSARGMMGDELASMMEAHLTEVDAQRADMARALEETVYQVVGSHQPILGPDANSDVIAARGQPVLVTAENFAAMVAALKKAGAL